MRNLINLESSTQKSQTFSLYCAAFARSYFSLGVMFDGTVYWCKIWRKTDFCFQKWHEEFAKFSREHLKVSKSGLWWDSFIQSRKCMSLKFTGGFFLMIKKKDAKLEGELTFRFKIDMCTLMGSFWSKYIMFGLRKYRVTFDGTEDWCKIWKKSDLCFLKWPEEFVKFSFTGW